MSEGDPRAANLISMPVFFSNLYSFTSLLEGSMSPRHDRSSSEGSGSFIPLCFLCFWGCCLLRPSACPHQLRFHCSLLCFSSPTVWWCCSVKDPRSPLQFDDLSVLFSPPPVPSARPQFLKLRLQPGLFVNKFQQFSLLLPKDSVEDIKVHLLSELTPVLFILHQAALDTFTAVFLEVSEDRVSSLH